MPAFLKATSAITKEAGDNENGYPNVTGNNSPFFSFQQLSDGNILEFFFFEE
jgi:hypothetical protein